MHPGSVRHGYGDLLHLGLIECRAGERTQDCRAYGASAALRFFADGKMRPQEGDNC